MHPFRHPFDIKFHVYSVIVFLFFFAWYFYRFWSQIWFRVWSGMLSFSTFFRPRSAGVVFEGSLTHCGSLLATFGYFLAKYWSFWVPFLFNLEFFKYKSFQLHHPKLQSICRTAAHTLVERTTPLHCLLSY